MSSTERPTRRGIFIIFGTILNAAAGLAIGIPVLRYLFSPKIRERRPGYDSWVPLGPVSSFPTGETRFATFLNPVVAPSDGETARVSCWVRNIDGRQFQIFAINCAHLGCPVRWFPQSNLFMCPCHGGAYYADGARASGPPERGLFEYRYKIEGDTLYIEAGQMPTPGSSLASLRVRRSTCA
jgi:Rieske Fe-S protein